MFIVRKCSTTEHQHDPKKYYFIFYSFRGETFYLVMCCVLWEKRLLAYSVYGTCPYQTKIKEKNLRTRRRMEENYVNKKFMQHFFLLLSHFIQH